MSTLGGFERETDIEERRKKRQEEWDRVRTADQPESKYFVLSEYFKSCPKFFQSSFNLNMK